jgi:saccharopine dehydrogenase (NADP+, L-glutamate forming)
MKEILILGAGRSSASLIRYMLDHAGRFAWRVTVGDADVNTARQKIAGYDGAAAIRFDITEPDSIAHIGKADIVVSLLPPQLHPIAAVHCLKFGKHLVTASYVSDEMRAFHKEAKDKGLVFLNECGLDPGIDHMSAMQIIDSIRANGGQLYSFESFTGGLIAPETDPANPWRYKFTWNPRNVVMAGQGTAKFLQGGKYKYIPYQQLFKRTTRVHVPGHGDYEGYANRDSLKYIDTYDLDGIETIVRGTLQNKGFCSAWNALVQLGCCDDSYELDNVGGMTHADFFDSFLPAGPSSPAEKLNALATIPMEGHETEHLRWAGFFDDEAVGLDKGTPAQVTEHILNKKWKLVAGDRDQIVMWHRFRYRQDGREREIQATLVATGTDSVYTAMAKTVGLPLGIAARLLSEGRIRDRGVMIPTSEELYTPILQELRSLGIELNEQHIP